MKKNQIIATVAFIAFGLGILAVVPPPASLDGTRVASQGALVQTYEGTTVCADCPGIVTRLILTKDAPYSAEGTYELSLTYLERDVAPVVLTGLWTTERGTPVDPDATVYALDPDLPDQTQRYLRVNSDTIRQLDRDGNEIDASLPFDLTRVPEASSSEGLSSEQKTVTGMRTCLVHKDGSVPQTRECILGFKDDDGATYVLDLGQFESEDDRLLLEGSERVELTGMFTPIELLSTDQWMTYQAIGVLSVMSMRPL